MPKVESASIREKQSGPSSKKIASRQTGDTRLLLQRAAQAPETLQADQVLQLQRMIGNRVTGRLLQAKLKLGPAGDAYEQEADRVAKQVVVVQSSRQPAAKQEAVQRDEMDEEMMQAKPLAESISRVQRAFVAPPSLQRDAMEEDELQAKRVGNVQRDDMEEDELQASPNHGLEGGDVDTDVAHSIQSAKGGGQPLHDGVRSSMERGFGADFGGVRVHTGGPADALNRSLNAKAFTTGKDIFFGKGQYNPGSSGGQELIAHELTHTVQQGAAGVQRETETSPIRPVQRHEIEERIQTRPIEQTNTQRVQRHKEDELQRAEEPRTFSVQRRFGGPVIQREIVADWLTESTLKTSLGFNRKRSSELKAIDTEVAKLQIARTGNDNPGIITAKQAIEQKIDLWRSAKGNNAAAEASDRTPIINKLLTAASVAAVAAKQVLAQSGRTKYAAALVLLKTAIETYYPANKKQKRKRGGKKVAAAVTAAKTAGVEYTTYNTTGGALAANDNEMNALLAAANANDRSQITPLGEAIITKIDDWQQTKTNYENFLTLEDSVGQYAAKVSSMGLDRFKPGTMGHKLEGLTMPRDLGGAMSDAAVDEATLAETEDYTNKKQVAGAAKIDLPGGGLDDNAITAIMDSSKHETTGETTYPELESLKGGGSGASSTAAQETTDTQAVGGTTVTRIYDATDANFAGRWALVQAAMQKIQGAGFTLPNFTVHLPKYGRQLSIANAAVGHAHTVTINADNLAAAQLFPPNTIMISPAYYKAPKVETGLSARIDPSGIATLVHEMGHMMHFSQSKGKFTQLNFSTWKGLAPDGTPWSDYVRAGVSQYGSGNPREFVAEFFVGLAYRNVDISGVNAYANPEDAQKTGAHIGRMTQNEAFMRMYKALGGAIPAPLAGDFAAL